MEPPQTTHAVVHLGLSVSDAMTLPVLVDLQCSGAPVISYSVARLARYMQRQGTASYDVIQKMVHAIGKLRDYYLLVHEGRPLKDGEVRNLLEDFLVALDNGNVLGWRPVSAAEFGATRASVFDYVKYLLDQSNDWPANDPDHRFLDMCRASYLSAAHAPKSLLFHTKKRARRKARGRKKISAGLRQYKPFPPKYLHELLLNTRNVRDRLLFSLLAFGGRRLSEMLHLYVGDAEAKGAGLSVQLWHPVQSKLTWRNAAGAEIKGTRLQYLRSVYGLLPRTEHGAMPSACGWKGIKFDDEAAMRSELYFIERAESTLLILHRKYLHDIRRSSIRANHPYYFVAADGSPLTISAVEKQFRLACRRLEKKHGISLAGFGVHSLRHYYGFYCADVLKADLLMIQKWMGHMQTSSTAVYTHISPATANAVMREAENRVNDIEKLVIVPEDRERIRREFETRDPLALATEIFKRGTAAFGEVDARRLSRRMK